jgi:hypothetical protein
MIQTRSQAKATSCRLGSCLETQETCCRVLGLAWAVDKVLVIGNNLGMEVLMAGKNPE